jgi:hypothetical protein
MRALLISLFCLLASHAAQAQAIVLPCVPSGASCIPVSAANPLPTTGGGGGGSGTVTSVSIVTANGISGTVATPTVTPAITLALGAITPTTVAIGAGSAITSSGAGGALGTNAFNSTAFSPFPPTGCATANGVVFNNATPCDTGFTYAGAGGNIAFTGTLSGPATGAAATTTYNFGTAGTGLFGTSTLIEIASAGTAVGFFNTSGLTLQSTNLIMTSSNTIGWGGVSFLSGVSAGTYRFGAADGAAPVAQTIGVQNVVTGTSNTGGANWTLNGSRSTGTGVGGKLIFQGSLTGSTGTAVNTNFPILTLNPGGATTATVQLGDGTNFTTYDSCTALTTGATGVMACTASAMRFKNLYPSQPLNVAGLDNLRTDIPWKYRDDAGHGLDTTRVHVGLFADDVEKLDPRCVVYRDGELGDYEDRCVIAYLVADRKKMKAEIEALRRVVNDRR